jgi:hypothetical protein
MGDDYGRKDSGSLARKLGGLSRKQETSAVVGTVASGMIRATKYQSVKKGRQNASGGG